MKQKCCRLETSKKDKMESLDHTKKQADLLLLRLILENTNLQIQMCEKIKKICFQTSIVPPSVCSPFSQCIP